VDVFGNNLTSGGDHFAVSVTLSSIAFNGSLGPAFGKAPSAGPFPTPDEGATKVRPGLWVKVAAVPASLGEMVV
jgi:hypothetical protein